MSEVMDKPRTARGSVALGNRVAGNPAGFYWYSAGRAAERRWNWMRLARESSASDRVHCVRMARKYHHEYLRNVARALEMQS